LISENGQKRFGERISASLKNAKVRFVIGRFGGECSIEEVTKHEKAFGSSTEPDCLIAVGGGKCIDAGKFIADGLRIPVLIVPTLASKDAPCSALSVMYSPEGVMSGVEFFQNPPSSRATGASAHPSKCLPGLLPEWRKWVLKHTASRNWPFKINIVSQ
jgi:glycerol dehydrogenase